MPTWAWKEEIPIHASQTMPSPLQEGRAHVGADRSAQRGPEVLSLGGASRQEAGDPVVGLELRPMKSSLGDRPLTLFMSTTRMQREGFSTR